MRRLLFVVMVICFGAEKVYAQSQPPEIVLNTSGVSKIFPPFDTEGWVYTRGSGDGTHMGDDYYAQDWARDCQSQGQRLYAGISGSLQLNYDRDGVMDYYGNTLLIVDYRSGFAQRFAHMQEFGQGLRTGDLILAGQYVGKVGSTGNVTASSSCASQGGKGAHAHIVLYKGVPKASGRPLSSISTTGGATQFAAQFRYTSQVPLIKSDADPTVYAVFANSRVPVTATVFANQGWNFDRNRVMFDPLAGNIKSSAVVNGMSLVNWFWPLRDGQLVRSPNDPTVFLVQDGFRKGLPGDVFSCRNFSFADVKVLPATDLRRYPPTTNPQVAIGCTDETRQALSDLTRLINLDGRLGPIELGTYSYDDDWDQSWELRWLNFTFSGGQFTTVYHATLRIDPSVRYTRYWDPSSNQWQGWSRMY